MSQKDIMLALLFLRTALPNTDYSERIETEIKRRPTQVDTGLRDLLLECQTYMTKNYIVTSLIDILLAADNTEIVTAGEENWESSGD